MRSFPTVARVVIAGMGKINGKGAGKNTNLA